LSYNLSKLQELAENSTDLTVALSPSSQSVLFFAVDYLKQRRNFVARQIEGDTVTDAEWDVLEEMVDGAFRELMTPLIGLIIPMALAVIPSNMLYCDGAQHAKSDYPDLAALLDPIYIVNASTFITPDLRGRTVLGSGTGTGLSSREIGQTGGEETHALSVPEMPSHQHGLFLGTGLAVAPGELPIKTPAFLPLDATDVTGSSIAHNNMQPFHVLKYAIIAK